MKNRILHCAAICLLALALCGCMGGIDVGVDVVAGENEDGDGDAGGTAIMDVTMSFVRLDGTTLDLSSQPVPRLFDVVIVFSEFIDESSRAAAEAAFSLSVDGGESIAGTFTWTDGVTLVFRPSLPLSYETDYVASVGSAEVNPASRTFVTLTRGDINGDAIADALIGSNGNPPQYTGGAAFIFLGGTIVSCDMFTAPDACAPDTSISGGAASDTLGTSVSIAGDLNADGYEDIIVGAPDADAEGGLGADRGEAYIWYGSSSGIADCDLATCDPDVLINGSTDFDRLGTSVAGAGDVNGDGYGDVIVGVPVHAEPGLVAAGEALIFYGSDLTSVMAEGDASEVVVGTAINEALGGTVAGGQDVNADGYEDVAIYSLIYAFVYEGSASGLGCAAGGSCTPSATIEEAAASDFGGDIKLIGDVNGDGYDELLIGARAASDGVTNPGRAYLMLGGPDGIDDCDLALGCADATISGVTDGDNLGSAVAGGDFNGDGFADLAIGARNYLDGIINPGAAFMLLGGTGGIADCVVNAGCVDATILGTVNISRLGQSASAGGDINGDGFEDLMLGAPSAGAAPGGGSVHVFYGKTGGVDDCDMGAGCDSDARIHGSNVADGMGAGVGAGR